MAYLGRPASAEVSVTGSTDTFTGDGNVAFTLSRVVTDNNPSLLEVFVSNVQQQPTVTFSVANNVLTFTSAPGNGEPIYVTFRDYAVAPVFTVPDASITAQKIQTDAITSDKIALNAVISNKIAPSAVTSIKIEANAITSAKIAANTSIQFAAGSNTAPSISVSGDTNTGIFFPAADTIAASTAGVERLRITSVGRLGLNIAAPTFTVDVVGPVNTFGDAIRNMSLFDNQTAAAGVGGGIAFGGFYDGTTDGVNDFAGIQGFKENATSGNFAGALKFTTRINGGNPTERMRITSAGNLLVGLATSIAAGVGIEVGEVGIDGVSGFGMFSAVSIADDATITLSANTGLLVLIEYFDGNNYPAAMFFCSYSAAVQLVSNSGGSFAATDSDNSACVFKGNNTDVVTVKNRLGATRGYSIHTLQLRGQ